MQQDSHPHRKRRQEHAYSGERSNDDGMGRLSSASQRESSPNTNLDSTYSLDFYLQNNKKKMSVVSTTQLVVLGYGSLSNHNKGSKS